MRPFRCTVALIFTSAFAFGQTGTINAFAGLQALGAGYSGDGAAAIAAQLNAPSGIAVDSAGNVYIADFNNAVVRLVSTSGIISTYAGTGTAGYSGNGGLAINAKLAGPLGLAVDSKGNLYIADGPNNAVREVTSTGIITTIAGGGVAGFSGDGGAATAAVLNDPVAVAVDSSGNVYIADSANHRVREISAGIINTIAGSGLAGYGGDNGPAASAQLFFPKGLAIDSQNNIYIADSANNRIRKVSAGTITTVAGNGAQGYLGDKGAPTSAELNTPIGVAIDPSGNLYIADTGNNVIRRVSGNVITTVAGNGVAGFGGDGGPATSAILHTPFAVAVDSTGGFTYIADTNNNVVRVITNTFVTGVIPHFAAGGTYVTGFYLINKSNQSAGFSLSFYDNTGTPVSVPISGQSASTSFSGTVPALGTAYYEIGNITDNPGVSGSVVVTSNAFVVVQALVRHLSSAGVYYEAAVPSTTGNFEILTAFDATTFAPTGQQIYTGFAFANIDLVNTGTVTCTAKDSGGNVIANAIPNLTLSPQGHGAGYNFPALFGKRGTIDCVSTTKMGVIALRFIGNDALSTLPVIPIR